MTALGHLVVRELRARGRDPVMPWVRGLCLLQWGVGLYAVLAGGKWARQQLGRMSRERFAGYVRG